MRNPVRPARLVVSLALVLVACGNGSASGGSGATPSSPSAPS